VVLGNLRPLGYAPHVPTATVVVRQLTNGTEAARILDALDAAVDLPSDRLSNGRRYTLRERTQTDRAGFVSTLEAELDKISDSWPIHVTIRGIN
jgi:hypothetical protein